jgi:hypothetical protein
MTPLFWVLVVIAAYFFIVFVLLRLLVPFMGFRGLEVPAAIPLELANLIASLEKMHTDPDNYMAAAYHAVVSRWYAGRMHTLYFAPLAFRKDLAKIWASPGYAHCNTQNYFLYVLLTKSSFFKAEDVRVKTVFFNFFIHQFLQVRRGSNWIALDPAGSSIRGLLMGSYCSFFG